MTTHVPLKTNLADVYSAAEVSEQRERFNRLCIAFKDAYGEPPSVIARSPGRVNLLGEHIDYCNFQVLPMAVILDVLVAVGRRPPLRSSAVLHVANIDPAFPPRTIPFTSDGVSIDPSAHDWTNYVGAGVRGAALEESTHSDDICILVDGRIPPGSGLSSSSALVVAVIAALRYPTAIPKLELARCAMLAERAVGVNQGGLDQAASVCAEPSRPILIDFVPSLSTRPLRRPLAASLPSS